MLPSGMDILLIEKYYITRATPLDGKMVCNVPEQEYIYFTLELSLTLKLLVYTFEIWNCRS